MSVDTVAITDHRCMFGVIEFYNECQKRPMKPLLGMKAFIVPATGAHTPFRRPRGWGGEPPAAARAEAGQRDLGPDRFFIEVQKQGIREEELHFKIFMQKAADFLASPSFLRYGRGEEQGSRH